MINDFTRQSKSPLLPASSIRFTRVRKIRFPCSAESLEKKWSVFGNSYKVTGVSRKRGLIKTVNLEEGMPTVEQARLRMDHELYVARQQGYAAVKLIHGYGSSGTGGVLRMELQKVLRTEVVRGAIRASIPGEQWSLSDETTWELLKKFPEWKHDSDVGRNNRGISIVVL